MKSVLIIGAGPTGLTAAVELARRGFRPRIVDQAAGHPLESRALAVNSRTLRILESAGLTEQIIAQGNLVTQMHASEADHRGDGKTLARLNLSEGPPPYNFIVILPQAETERILASAFPEFGIDVEWNTALTKLSLEADGKAVVCIDGPKGSETLRPDFVIGADGSHSVVRKSLGIGFEGERQVDPFGLVDVRLSQPVETNELRLRFYPRGLMGFIPMGEDLGRFVATDPSLLDRLPEGYAVSERLWETDFHISFRHVERFQQGNVFLAGDAAHIHSPVGGRGMNLGIEDAAWLAWLLSEGQAEQYTQDRLRVARFVLSITRNQTWFASSGGIMAGLIRRYALPVALRASFARQRAIKLLRAQDTPEPPWL